VEIDAKEDLVLLPYSSGTTGVPKGVMLTHFNVVSNAQQMLPMIGFTSDDAFIAFLPFTHIYALVCLSLLAPFEGATVVVMSKFDPAKFLTAVQTHRLTVLHVVPPVCVFLSKHPVVSKFDLSSVHTIFSAAAPLGEELAGQLKTRLGEHIDIRQGYGMTELSPCATVSPKNNTSLGSAGVLVPNTIARIVDAEGNDVKTGDRGELWISGPQVMKGYFLRPEATATTIDSDGFLHTGDIAVIDADGYISIVDRLKELIKYNGYQVPPAELEALLLGNDKIADVAVIGIPAEGVGELPRAYIVKKPNVELTEEEVHTYLTEQGISHYKKLRGGVRFVTTIPKSASGKILRRVLRAEAEAEKNQE
jgi:acyl-CoA synthetase (AMP-forming)/AMP-acid ligase II